MAEIIPFRGILYDVSKVSIEDVLAPPYDIITPEYRKELYRKSPYNIVRIDLGKKEHGDNKKENKYTRARRYLDEWKKKGILFISEKPLLYACGMSYNIDGKDKNIVGLLGLVKIEELGKGKIYPHECTYSKPKKDRLNLLRTCKANISPIFSLYKSPANNVSNIMSRIIKMKPYLEVADEKGAIHRLWQIDENTDIEIIRKELEDKEIFIADGHHRYETSLEFQREVREKKPPFKEDAPFDYVLMFLANMLDEGLTILPAHRLLKKIPKDIHKRLSEHFEISSISLDVDITKKMMGKRHVFGFYQNKEERWYLLAFKGGNLGELPPAVRCIDVFILHDLILKKILNIEDISYEMEINNAIERVRNGEFEGVFFLNPTTIEDVEKAALSSIRMPPKSTYFYPKLLTGVVINSFSVFDDYADG